MKKDEDKVNLNGKKEEMWSLTDIINEMINAREINYESSNVHKKIKKVDKLASNILATTYCTSRAYKIPTSHKQKVKLLLKCLFDEDTVNGQSIYQIAQKVTSLQADINKGISIITPPSGIELVNRIITILSNSNVNVDIAKLERMRRYYTENQEPTKNQELLEYVKKAIEETEYAILNIPHDIIGILNTIREQSLGTLAYVLEKICDKWQEVIRFTNTLILLKQNTPSQFERITFEKDLDESILSPQLIKNIGIPKFLEKSMYTAEQMAVKNFIVGDFIMQENDIIGYIEQVEHIGKTLRKLDLKIEELFYNELLNGLKAVNVICNVFNQLAGIEEIYAEAYIEVLKQIIIGQLKID